MERRAHRENKTKQKKEAFVCHYGWTWMFASASFRRHKNPVRYIFDLMMIKKTLICVLRIFSLWYVLSLSKLCSRLDVHIIFLLLQYVTLTLNLSAIFVLCCVFLPHHCNFVKKLFFFCVNIPTASPPESRPVLRFCDTLCAAPFLVFF